jgi:hypothetical protein
MNFVAFRYATGRYRRAGVGAAQKLAQNLKKSKDAPDRPCPSFVRSFQGPRGQTHTHKPRKGVRGRRSTGKKIVRVHVPVKRHRGEPGHTRTTDTRITQTNLTSIPTHQCTGKKDTGGSRDTHGTHTGYTGARSAHGGSRDKPVNRHRGEPVARDARARRRHTRNLRQFRTRDGSVASLFGWPSRHGADTGAQQSPKDQRTSSSHQEAALAFICHDKGAWSHVTEAHRAAAAAQNASVTVLA